MNEATATVEHEMVIAEPGNPTRVVWNGKVEEQELARARFNEKMDTNAFFAYATVDVGTAKQKNVQITEFDEQAERIVLTPRIAGGC